MVYKYGLSYFSYFCNANHIQRGTAAHKKASYRGQKAFKPSTVRYGASLC